MDRGSRLAASFLLLVTGFAVSAVALFVAPKATGSPLGIWLAPAAIVFALGHWVALVGVVRSREWGRATAAFVAELGGGLAILAAVALLTGARTFGAAWSAAQAFAAWVGFVYALIGIAAGHIQVRVPVSGHGRSRRGLAA